MGKLFPSTTPKVTVGEIHPLYCWYGDVYLYNRQKYLIFTNSLTRVSLMIGPYSVDKKEHFSRTFALALKQKLSTIIQDSDAYFEKIEGDGWIAQPDKGATAFVNRIKEELNYLKEYWKAMDDKIMVLPEDFNNTFLRNVTSIKGKYFYPEDKFVEEWEKYKSESIE